MLWLKTIPIPFPSERKNFLQQKEGRMGFSFHPLLLKSCWDKGWRRRWLKKGVCTRDFPIFRTERKKYWKGRAKEFNNILCRPALRFKYFFPNCSDSRKKIIFRLVCSQKIYTSTLRRINHYDSENIKKEFGLNFQQHFLTILTNILFSEKKEHFLLSWARENALSIQECSTTASASDCREEKEGKLAFLQFSP